MGEFLNVPGPSQQTGNRRGFVFLALTVSPDAEVTTVFTAAGQPVAAIPDFGFCHWFYSEPPNSWYGAKIPLTLTSQGIMTDVEGVDNPGLLVVPRRGVTVQATFDRFRL